MNNPLVSIIVPCYNQAQYLDQALQSVLNQTYDNWECIIVNDGSPDNTKEITHKWIVTDNRFVYLYQENSGVSSARNLGIAFSTGTFILPLDADDKISPDYVALAVESFQAEKSLKVVYCKAEKFGDEVGMWNLPSFTLKELSLDNVIFCTAMFRKEDWKLVGGYDNRMVSGWEDWEFWIALLKDGGKVKCLETVGFYYRIKDISRQKQMIYDNMKHLLEYLSVKHADFFVAQYGSFIHLNNIIKQTQKEKFYKLRSKKFVVDVFCKTFFGFSIFGIYKKDL
ncbi:glycosyltransferase family 2 protein [Flavobacterium psychrolimnae]|uniref:Glycosyltransferase family 2 protein n=1 Tax=Flavobacterium psychrolimnae TaxID=249351 RepID=A0A366B0Y8_9FLAO|nr:glycosyltransferase family A protein [Flavobacterium psychrolimnae]RBN50313.1 glycosyltransferase family 2 protein [Flavobacterium psychrolimnae]